MAIKRQLRYSRSSYRAAVHPGEMLLKEFMEPCGITVDRLAAAISAPEIRDVIREERPITADLALRLSKCFGNSAEQWMDMQRDYDLRMAAATVRLGRIRPFHYPKSAADEVD